MFFHPFPAAPGLVTNLTAYAQNHSFVVVTWFLPHRINGLITKFAVKAKHARTGQTVRNLEVNAEEIMTGALPHCNVLDISLREKKKQFYLDLLFLLFNFVIISYVQDAADILSRATPSPLEITASSPAITLSAVPPAASWNVPISVGVDQLRPYTAYLFEVSAFTSDGEGQVASTMVRMPESGVYKQLWSYNALKDYQGFIAFLFLCVCWWQHLRIHLKTSQFWTWHLGRFLCHGTLQASSLESSPMCFTFMDLEVVDCSEYFKEFTHANTYHKM